MSLTKEEKGLLQEALQVYIQIVSRQLPPQHVQKIAQIAEGVLKKIDSLGSGNQKGNKPAGISDEWFKNVCRTCDKLGPNGCMDKVTEKFPGKCDPILHYEMEKKKAGR
jgi:hypothetical protein